MATLTGLSFSALTSPKGNPGHVIQGSYQFTGDDPITDINIGGFYYGGSLWTINPLSLQGSSTLGNILAMQLTAKVLGSTAAYEGPVLVIGCGAQTYQFSASTPANDEIGTTLSAVLPVTSLASSIFNILALGGGLLSTIDLTLNLYDFEIPPVYIPAG